MNYLIHRANRREGPFPAEAIRESLARGHLAANDLCWNESMPTWAPIGSVPELAPAAQAAGAHTPFWKLPPVWLTCGLLLALWIVTTLGGRIREENRLSQVKLQPGDFQLPRGGFKATFHPDPPFLSERLTGLVHLIHFPRSKLSLEVERGLEALCEGGVTQQQMIATSDAVAALIAKSGISDDDLKPCLQNLDTPGREAFIVVGIGELGQNNDDDLHDKAVRLNLAIQETLPTRMALFDPYTMMRFLPLPARPFNRSANHSRDGALLNERLIPFEGAFSLQSDSITARSASYIGYWNAVVPTLGYNFWVLAATYRNKNSSSPDEIATDYYWYGRKPAGLDETLKKVSADNPVREFGPPVWEAPDPRPAARLTMLAEAESRAADAADEADMDGPAFVYSASQNSGLASVLGSGGLFGFPHDPNLLKKLFHARFDKIGTGTWANLDLLAVLKAYSDTGIHLDDQATAELKVTPGEYVSLIRNFEDTATILGSLAIRGHPSYSATVAMLHQEGGSSERSQTILKNLIIFMRQRSGDASVGPHNGAGTDQFSH